MNTFTHIYKDGKDYVERSYRERIMGATPKENFLSWKINQEYEIFILKLWNKKLAIYKAFRHFNEDSGYKVYATMDELLGKFELRRGIEYIPDSERRLKNYKPKDDEVIFDYSERI